MWIVYALLASAVWGLDYVLAEKFYRQHVSPLSLLALQSLIAALVFVPLALTRGLATEIRNIGDLQVPRWQIPVVLLGFLAGNYLIACAIQAKNATLASLIEISYPLPIILFSLLFIGSTHVTPSVMVGGGLIVAGVVIIFLFN